MRIALLAAFLLVGCFDGREPEKEFGCGPQHVLTLTEGGAPAGSFVIPADSTDNMRFPLWFILLAEQRAAAQQDEAANGEATGATPAPPGVTEFQLTWLEWSMVATVLDDAAVASGAPSVGPVEDNGYLFYVMDGERTFRYAFLVMLC